MAWFRKERKTRTTDRQKLEIPPDVWEKCEECGHVDVRDNFARSHEVCPACGHHRRIDAVEYITLLTDEGSFDPLDQNLRSVDALKFEAYKERLAASLKKAGPDDAILTGRATMEGLPICLGVMSFKFMGGSMGSVVGEKIARLALHALKDHNPLIIVSASGGARMQEGVLSLMQLAKTSVVIAQLRQKGIPFISIVTNPTTGGVSASYAMQGDVIIAEPGAVVGFAGPRVIKQTIGQDLPEGFQTAEFLLEHGMVDVVVPRSRLRQTTGRLLRMLLNQPALEGEPAA